ncbi:hypothetical protein [Providencia rettgeri]|uniref:hypothetical protein n=1 Tax=Providencia rettgeri TaxID=587 RepID=UPI0034E09C78
MKKTGILLAAVMVLVGCQAPNSTLVYDCNIDQSINQISRDRNGYLTFETAAPKARVYMIDNSINIFDFEYGEYKGYELEKSEVTRKILTIKDFDVTLNKGDFFHEDPRIVEIVSPSRKTITLFWLNYKTGMTKSVQFLTQCEKKYIVLPEYRSSHSDNSH